MSNTILLGFGLLVTCSGQSSPKVYDIGSRLEPFVDDWLIEKMDGVQLQLHHPTPSEVAIVFDKSWEGNTCTYVIVFQDDDLFRMYYRGSHYDFATKKSLHELTCYAESKDGINWTKPELNLFEFDGSTRNNIVWRGELECHNFSPFKDSNPCCQPEARYKALGGGQEGLFAFQSSDGINWSLMQPDPVITKGDFDSQNLAFWDTIRKRYVDFHRAGRDGIRSIMTCTSDDFLNWSEPEWVDFGQSPPEHLYTNAITPYFRAPHIFLGFPKRFLPSRKIPHHPDSGISDGVFMSSRDGLHWHRWLEAFIRPGLQPERWVNRNNMTAWGILSTKTATTGPTNELSIYSNENYYSVDGHCRLRRFTLRNDGFASVHASYAGGEFVTYPLNFSGTKLTLNFSTSAAGSIRVEITNLNGQPLSGFSLDESTEIYGDEVAYVMTWKSQSDLTELVGQPIQLRFVMKDADLYSLQFRP